MSDVLNDDIEFVPREEGAMANSEDLLTEIRNALGNLVTLEIVTAVGQIKREPNQTHDIDWDSNPQVCLTKIDLLQGDIKTVYHPSFVTGDYQALREFHAAREKEGYDIVQHNLDAVRALYGLAVQLLAPPASAGLK
jgi:hypothetical protein